ncbi:MAG: mechanosensitive ion channel [Acidobacteria bacterium]|nr:mechanosensitive ion channel [Acidobacteriota bacterium]MDA1234882.1 mechanosensitive ion channel [Acidobacteriota bacterium]
MQSNYTDVLYRWFAGLGLADYAAAIAVDSAQVLVLLTIALIANFLVQKILLSIVHRLSERTATDWDNVLVAHRTFHHLAQLAPAIVIYSLAPAAFELPQVADYAQRGALIYMLLVGVLSMNSGLNAANEIYQRFEVAKRIPILGYLQVVKLIVTLAALIGGISIWIQQSPLLLLSGLGAMTAILLLVFKDTILGLVAGIQLVANDMVRPGDWLEMPKYGADGDVEEITLNVVKIRNWDKTVTTIPTYALISDSFKNWRGMSESGGRRIKRSLLIDISSIKFCPPELLEQLKKIHRLGPFIEQRSKEIAEASYGPADNCLANGRRMTNIGLFRQYTVEYLRNNSAINKDMTFLARQLQPTSEGLPLEVYVFSADQRWVQYEGIQGDIFYHLFAVLPLFELRAYQKPAGFDIARGTSAAAGAAD